MAVALTSWTAILDNLLLACISVSGHEESGVGDLAYS